MIYTSQFLGAQPTQFHHRRAERNHSDHYMDSELTSQLPNSFSHSLSAKLRSANLPVLCLWCDMVGD